MRSRFSIMIKKVVRKPRICVKIKEGDEMDRRKPICGALAYIESGFSERLILRELAKTAGYSAPQFSRVFLRYCGVTPMRYVNIVRVLAAARLVSESALPITEIAFGCGFGSLEVFERGFRKYFGMTASDYRRRGASVSTKPFYLSEQIYYERLRSKMIDGGSGFDWGRTAEIYAKYRNIYPNDFWVTLNSAGVGRENQKILDIGTGTGILPMNMSKFGGEYTGADLSAEMIRQAEIMCADIPNAKFLTADAHKLPFESGSFDIVTALQCWVYFDKGTLIPELHRVLKSGGELYVMFMTWLPGEDEIIRRSFSLVNKYNLAWSGCMKRADNMETGWAKGYFRAEDIIKKDYRLPFTRESWCGRMTASRGIGAALIEDKIARFRAELTEMLEKKRGGKFYRSA